jgi:hypothetical protein
LDASNNGKQLLINGNPFQQAMEESAQEVERICKIVVRHLQGK